MNCIINPGVEDYFEFHPSDKYLSEVDLSTPRRKIITGCSSSDSSDSASALSSSPLPQMTPPSTDSITSHFQIQSNINLTNGSSNASRSLQTILSPTFLKSTKENYIQPIYDASLEQVILPVECGPNQALMYLTKLCQGSKGPCILFKSRYWLTPNEFQYISGRETAKDWKRSIRHNGKSIKLLINKGILCVHSPLCECGTVSNSFIKISKNQSGINQHQEQEFDYFHQHHSPLERVKESCSSSSSLSMMKMPFGVLGYECSGSSGGSCVEPRGYLDWSRFTRPKSGTSVGDMDSLGTEGSSPRSLTEWTSCDGNNNKTGAPNMGLSESDMDNGDGEKKEAMKLERSSPSSWTSEVNTISATESQSDEPSLTGSTQTGSNDSSVPVKSKRKSKQGLALKSERQSPQLSSSTTSPPMTPPPPSANSIGQSNNNSTGSSPPPQPIKQMEQMMSSSARNYSDFMRSLAAKYNQQQSNLSNEYYRASPGGNFGFDTRFLKPAAAAALLNLSCSQLPSSIFLEKEKFPMIDMSSTQTLLSMVRSASAAAANNLESLKTNSHQQHSNNNKRPNSPLDLSSRDLPNTPPPLKKSKLRNPLDVTLKASPATTIPCLSSCSTGSGCTEEAQTMINWSVEDVCRFVSTIDLCKDYVEVFREHSIDGSSLPLLTEEHLINAMNLKLGPALKFRSTVARKLGSCVVCSHCTHCHSHNNNTTTHSP